MLHTSVKEMLGVEFDDTVVDPDVKYPWTPDVRDAIKKRRARRSDRSLMIDHLMSVRVSKKGKSRCLPREIDESHKTTYRLPACRF